MVSAMKQSGQAWLPRLFRNKTISRNHHALMLTQKFICFVDSQNPDQLKASSTCKSKSYLVLIGPEGDFPKRRT
jgi:16S rRNA U1498 N3-methylase RsmE